MTEEHSTNISDEPYSSTPNPLLNLTLYPVKKFIPQLFIYSGSVYITTFIDVIPEK